MFLVVLKKNKKQFIMEFIYCRWLNLQYFGAPKSGAPKMRPPRGYGYCGGGSYATEINRVHKILCSCQWKCC